MTGTNGAIRSVDKKAIGASCLIAVVFDNESFAREPSQKHGQKCRPGGVDHIGGAHKLPEPDNTGTANHAKWKFSVVTATRRRFGDHRYVKFAIAIQSTQFGDARCQRLHNAFDAADTWREIMGINQ